jgi:hypothetical protein
MAVRAPAREKARGKAGVKWWAAARRLGQPVGDWEVHTDKIHSGLR